MASADIISRLNSKLNTVVQDRESPDYLTRDIGGHWRKNHPFISGYFQVWFGVPERLFQQSSGATAVSWLHSSCENFSPHSHSINSVDIPGIGQTGSSFVSSMAITREFSLSFREWQNQPILNIIRLWGSVFDPHVGVSPLRGSEFMSHSYKGWAMVVQLKPVGAEGRPIEADDIEEVYIYEGVYPKSIPVDTVAQSDVQANDSVQISVPFSFDGFPLMSSDDGVIDKALSYFSSFKYTNTFDKYHHFVGT